MVAGGRKKVACCQVRAAPPKPLTCPASYCDTNPELCRGLGSVPSLAKRLEQCSINDDQCSALGQPDTLGEAFEPEVIEPRADGKNRVIKWGNKIFYYATGKFWSTAARRATIPHVFMEAVAGPCHRPQVRARPIDINRLDLLPRPQVEHPIEVSIFDRAGLMLVLTIILCSSSCYTGLAMRWRTAHFLAAHVFTHCLSHI